MHDFDETFIRVNGVDKLLSFLRGYPKISLSSWGEIRNKLGTVSGSGTGLLDYGATGPVPDTEPRL